MLFLAAMGSASGRTSTSRQRDQALGGLSYLQFLAPGPARRDGDADGGVRVDVPDHGRAQLAADFHAMYATPIVAARHRPRQPRLDRVRLTLIAAIFTVVMVAVRRGRLAADRARRSRSAVLTGLAFAAPIAAFAATQRTPSKFNVIFRFGITPLFLFSGTFFPISNAAASSSSRSPGCRRCGTAWS